MLVKTEPEPRFGHPKCSANQSATAAAKNYISLNLFIVLEDFNKLLTNS